MQALDPGASVDSSVLLEIIRTQTDIAKLSLDLGEVVNLAAARVQQLTHADGAVVELVENGEMVYRGASGMAETMVGLRLRPDASLSGLCVKRGMVLRCDDTEADTRVDREACRKIGLLSMVVAPLNHNGTTVGVLKIISASPAAFDDRDVKILTLITDLIAAALFRAAYYANDELFRRATHDGLTGLANRALFYDRLHYHLDLARRRGSQVGLLYLDLDGLKAINDTFGHRAGDAALCEAATRIRRASRKSDSVARFGGDEFAVILADVQAREGASQTCERLTAEVLQPFEFEGHTIPLSASIGLAIFPDDGADIESLVEAADQSMYAVKRSRNPR